MNNDEKRFFAINYAQKFIGDWYKWGGDVPGGFDCSGFVLEILQACGKVPRKFDTTASGIQNIFSKNIVTVPRDGCLVFYGTPIIHVEMVLNDELSIGASGGGSKTVTIADAIRDKAFIKVRPFGSRAGINCFVDPFK